MVVAWTFALGPGVAVPVMRRLPRHWFRVPAGERVLHRMLGVGIFGWLLERSGWNRHVADPMRGFDGTRAGLPSLELSVRGGAAAHGTCFAIHIRLAAVALFTGPPWGALWMLLPGVVVHLYPVLLQRSIMHWPIAVGADTGRAVVVTRRMVESTETTSRCLSGTRGTQFPYRTLISRRS